MSPLDTALGVEGDTGRESGPIPPARAGHWGPRGHVPRPWPSAAQRVAGEM